MRLLHLPKIARIRHLRKQAYDWFIVFNEEKVPINTTLDMKDAYLLNPYTNEQSIFTGELSLAGHELVVLIQ